ncbi:hypothetical protein MW887_000059 [Aspergillus wentii]|nr:hypothetical protein MW887_000059 [Aspergillus wentii]
MDLPPLSKEQLSTVLTTSQTAAELLDILAEYENEACLLSPDSSNSELLSFFYSSFFISTLLADKILEARILTKRMPQTLLQNDPSLQNCLNLLRAVWQHRHDQVYKILRELPWSESLKPLVDKYDVHFQEKTLTEISRAYEAIRPATAASYLGLDPASAEKGDPATIQRFTACGWKWNEETQLLEPKRTVTPSVPDGRLFNELGEVMALINNYGS